MGGGEALAQATMAGDEELTCEKCDLIIYLRSWGWCKLCLNGQVSNLKINAAVRNETLLFVYVKHLVEMNGGWGEL